MAASFGKGVFELFLDDKKLRSGLQRAESKLKSFSSTAKALGGALLATGAAGIGLFKHTIDSASDAQEELNKFKVLLGDVADEGEAFADKLASDVGRSAIEIKGSMAEIQGILSGYGLSAQEALKYTKQLTAAAIDTGSIFNREDTDVAHDFAAALSGSSETVQKYGINIKEAMVNIRLMEQGLDGLTGAELEQAKVMAKAEIIMESLTERGVMGDALRTANSYANQKKRLGAAILEAKNAVGNAFLPAIEALVPKLVSAAEAAAKWISENQDTVVLAGQAAVGLTALGAALIGAGLAAGALATAASALPAILSAVAAGLAWAIAPEGIKSGIQGIVSSIMDLVKGLYEVVTATEKAKQLSRDITKSGQMMDKQRLDESKSMEAEKEGSGVAHAEKWLNMLENDKKRTQKMIADLEKDRAAAEEKASGWFGDDTELSQLNLEVAALEERLKGTTARAEEFRASMKDITAAREQAAKQAEAEAAMEEKLKQLQAQSQANKDAKENKKSDAEIEREKELKAQAAANKSFLKSLTGGIGSGLIKDPSKYLEEQQKQLEHQDAVKGIASGERSVQDVISQLMSGQGQVAAARERNTATVAGSAEAQAAIRGSMEPQVKTNDLLERIHGLLEDVEQYQRESRDDEASGVNQTTGSV